MTINISLSDRGIDAVVRKLENVRDSIEEGLEQIVSILTSEGAIVAQSAYGDFGVEAVPQTEGTRGDITVIGDMPLIAEFGAGDTVINPSVLFENSPETPVYPGSYSIEEGSKEYATYGSWHFGGARYTQVEPHLGLFQAKQYIINNSTDVATEVMHYD